MHIMEVCTNVHIHADDMFYTSASNNLGIMSIINGYTRETFQRFSVKLSLNINAVRGRRDSSQKTHTHKYHQTCNFGMLNS